MDTPEPVADSESRPGLVFAGKQLYNRCNHDPKHIFNWKKGKKKKEKNINTKLKYYSVNLIK